jgi:carbamoyl-phosphate synthase large subunit
MYSGLDLESSGGLRRYGVRVLGTPISTLEATEDCPLFVDMLDDIGVKTARSKAVSRAGEAVSTAKEIGFPFMLRAAFALRGKGSRVARNEAEGWT